MIRTVIVDDEPLARAGLRDFLTAERDATVVAECGDGKAAIETIQSKRPDLVLLDIGLPEASGFDVLSALPSSEMPVIVFVTAHDQFALEAFEAHAMDYLLKPVERARFGVAMERARAALQYRGTAEFANRLASLITDLRSRSPYRDRLTIRETGRTYFVRTADVDWVEAAGNYARLHVGQGRHALRETITALERQLDPARFARTHRSVIVNLGRIKEMRPGARGDQVIILQDGTRLPLSVRYRDALEQRLAL